MTAHWLTVAVLCTYLLVLILIGLISKRRSDGGLTSFFLAGRSLGKWTVALSAVSSGRSSFLILGVTGTAYAFGLQAIWAVAGYITVEVFMFFFVARRFRLYSEMTNSITIPDILTSRYNDTSYLLRIISSLILVFFMTSYVSAQIVGGGTAFSSGLGVTTSTGMWLTAAIILIYTTLGGFYAVSKTDVLQIGFMLFSIILLPIVAIVQLGGIGPVFEAMMAEGGGFVSPFAFGVGVILGLLGIGFGSPGNPQILVRYMSLQNVGQMRQAALISSVWNVVLGWGAVMVGLTGRALVPGIAEEDRETIFTAMGSELFNPLIFGLLLVAVLAAIMSSADSQLLVGSSTIVRDIYDKMIGRGREISQERLVLYSRLSVLFLMGLSMALAFTAQDFVFWLVLFAWGGLGASFGPALLLSLYWRRTTRWGVLSGMVVGLVTVILVSRVEAVQEVVATVLFGITYEGVPGFLLSLLVTVVVSLLTRKPDHADKLLDDLSR